MKTKACAPSSQASPFKWFVGVDPGRDGAVALLDEKGALVFVGDAKSADGFGLQELEQVLHGLASSKEAVCVVERPVAMPGIHGSVLITLTLAAGAAIGAAASSGVHVETPTASAWKRNLGLTSDKTQSVAMARQMFGDALPARCRHDKCEAALLAYWAFKKYSKGR